MTTMLIDLIFRAITLGLTHKAIKDRVQAEVDAKGLELTPQEFADLMEQICDEKADESRPMT